ncbi:MAG: NfeD family protein [Lentisphaeria bacterium]
MEPSLIFALLITGILLIFAELLLPGGIIGSLGGIALIAGLVGIFQNYGFVIGTAASLITAFAMLTLFYLWFKYFPKTKAGKRLLASNDAQEWHSYNPEYIKLLGLTGTTQTILRPSGKVRINEHKYDVVTQGEILPPGTAIKVVEVEGNRIVVEKIEP